jgi:hypothetical protein
MKKGALNLRSLRRLVALPTFTALTDTIFRIVLFVSRARAT